MSTLWFARKSKQVTAIETDPIWAREVKRMAEESGFSNITLIEQVNFVPANWDMHINAANIISIDGAWRREIAEYILRRGILGKVIVLDNTDPGARGAELPALFESAGHSVMRFKGLGPCLLHEWETAICIASQNG
jgi:predicted O-methyltransferase YrrM